MWHSLSLNQTNFVTDLESCLTTMSRISFARRMVLMALMAFIGLVFVPLRLHAQENSSRKVLFCSTTQVADFARNVVGDRWEVICVLGAGEDPHTYQPGNDDLETIKRADLCLENGLHLEGNEWMKDLAKNAQKPLVTCTQGIASAGNGRRRREWQNQNSE